MERVSRALVSVCLLASVHAKTEPHIKLVNKQYQEMITENKCFNKRQRMTGSTYRSHETETVKAMN